MQQPDTPPSSLPPSTRMPLAAAPSAASVVLGEDVPRPGWGILLFIFLLTVLSLAGNFVTAKSKQILRHSATQSDPYAAGRTTSVPEFSPEYLIPSEGSSLLVVLLATSAMSRIENRPFTTYGLAGTRRLPHLLQGLLCGILCLSLLILTLRGTHLLAFDGRLLPARDGLRYGTIWVIGFALVAFAEELSVRGYLQYTLTRGLHTIIASVSNTPNASRWAFWSAAFLLSCVFGLLHTSNPGESPLGLLSAALAGLAFSFALYRTGSLWWAIGFHTTWDWAQSFLYGVPDSGTMVQHHLLATHPNGPAMLSGGPTGPEGSILILPTLALVAALIAVTLPQRAGVEAEAD